MRNINVDIVRSEVLGEDGPRQPAATGHSVSTKRHFERWGGYSYRRKQKSPADRHLVFLSLQVPKGRQYFTSSQREWLHQTFSKEIRQGTIRHDDVTRKLDKDFVKSMKRDRGIGREALVGKVLNSVRAVIRKRAR